MIMKRSLTSTEPWYALHDAFIDVKWFRRSNTPEIKSTLGEDPELGIDKRSGCDRVP